METLINNKIIKIESDSKKIYDQIQKFLDGKETKSSKRQSNDTKKAYEKDIRDFFICTRNKEINELNVYDLEISLDDYEDFIKEMRQSMSYSNSTINRKLYATKSLFKYLHLKKINGKRIVEEIDFLDGISPMPNESESHGVLSIEEVKRMAELSLEEREKSKIKYYFFILGLDTALRKEELLALKWSDFQPGKHTVVIKGLGKGNRKFRKEISIDLFNRLQEINNGQERVLTISSSAIESLFSRLRKRMDIPEERNIVIHSIRKAAINHFYQTTKDPFATMKFANHQSFNTTTVYIQEESYGAMGAISFADGVDMDLYRKVSVNNLLAAIENLDYSDKLKLNKKLMEIMDK